MRKSKLMVWVTIVVVLVLGAAVAVGPIMSRVKEPAYKVISKEGNIEIRNYAPMLIAEVYAEGTREEAAKAGFRLLADFIFGNNAPAEKIEMTAPVIQSPGTKIAMTAPVTQDKSGSGWKVRFVMPAEYTLETLPRPNNEKVNIIPVEEKKFAVIRFSGSSSSSNLDSHRDQLMAYLREKKIPTRGDPVLAFYNPPWTLPILRRNEIMIEVEG